MKVFCALMAGIVLAILAYVGMQWPSAVDHEDEVVGPFERNGYLPIEDQGYCEKRTDDMVNMKSIKISRPIFDMSTDHDDQIRYHMNVSFSEVLDEYPKLIEFAVTDPNEYYFPTTAIATKVADGSTVWYEIDVTMKPQSGVNDPENLPPFLLLKPKGKLYLKLCAVPFPLYIFRIFREILLTFVILGREQIGKSFLFCVHQTSTKDASEVFDSRGKKCRFGPTSEDRSDDVWARQLEDTQITALEFFGEEPMDKDVVKYFLTEGIPDGYHQKNHYPKSPSDFPEFYGKKLHKPDFAELLVDIDHVPSEAKPKPDWYDTLDNVISARKELDIDFPILIVVKSKGGVNGSTGWTTDEELKKFRLDNIKKCETCEFIPLRPYDPVGTCARDPVVDRNMNMPLYKMIRRVIGIRKDACGKICDQSDENWLICRFKLQPLKKKNQNPNKNWMNDGIKKSEFDHNCYHKLISECDVKGQGNMTTCKEELLDDFKKRQAGEYFCMERKYQDLGTQGVRDKIFELLVEKLGRNSDAKFGEFCLPSGVLGRLYELFCRKLSCLKNIFSLVGLFLFGNLISSYFGVFRFQFSSCKTEKTAKYQPY